LKSAPEFDLLIPDHVVAFYRKKEPDAYDPDATQLLFLIRALAQRLNDVSSIWLAPFGLTPLSFQVLQRLQAAPGNAMSLSAITRSLHTRANTMTALIDGLERDGLLRRGAHATDRRATIATLSAKGKKLIAKASLSQHTHIKRLMGGIADRERQLAVKTLLAISTGLNEEKARLRSE
jgi:DNA-binding MarR family transcriptional regulator